MTVCPSFQEARLRADAVRACALPKRRLAALLISIAGLCAGFGPAQAQQTPAGGGLRHACFNDAKSLCSGTRPGGGRILACLRENAASLSPGCQQALMSLKSQTAGPGR